jgi:replication-associated recombination protein RarA
MSVRERIEHACRAESNETFPERHDGIHVDVSLGDLRKMLAVLNYARAMVVENERRMQATYSEELDDAVRDCDEDEDP